mmetsp:Transcript_6684/g.7764  ORF Transcript_6684/g.7764 Transcript_6684/m.7764 type:complete len:172 (-) Transcript_6684:107-622(-)
MRLSFLAFLLSSSVAVNAQTDDLPDELCLIGCKKTGTANTGTLKIKPFHNPDFCVDITDVEPGRLLVLRECNDRLSQVWRIDENGKIRNKSNGRCVKRQGMNVRVQGCAASEENDVTFGFGDTIVFGNRGVMTPGATSEDGEEIALSVAARNHIGGPSRIPDPQLFTFAYL